MQEFDYTRMLTGVWPFLIMAAIFYFMLDRPHKKEQQKRARMLEALKRGDKVVTVGGIYGTIVRVSEKKVDLKIAEGVEVELLRSAISAFQDPEKQEEAEKKK